MTAPRLLAASLGDVLGQIAAPLQLGNDEQDADQVAKGRRGQRLAAQPLPHEKLDLRRQVVDRLVPFDDTQPVRDVVAQERLGCAGQCLGNQGEELGHPDFNLIDLALVTAHGHGTLPA